MIGYGYAQGFATGIFAVGGIMGIIGSFLFGVINQKMGTKKAFPHLLCLYYYRIYIYSADAERSCFSAGWRELSSLRRRELCAICCPPMWLRSTDAGITPVDTVSSVQFLRSARGIGVMMIGIFQNAAVMYTFDIVTLVIGFIFMIASSDKFIGKAG